VGEEVGRVETRNVDVAWSGVAIEEVRCDGQVAGAGVAIGQARRALVGR
jgi:hypothetical protein